MAHADFTVADAVAAERVRSASPRLLRAYEQGEATALFLRGSFALNHGLVTEAYEHASTLAQRAELVGNGAVARLALASLEDAGLRERGSWERWARTYVAAGK